MQALAVIDINGKFLSRETIPLVVQKSSKVELKQAIAKIAKSARTLQETFSDRLFAGVGVSVSGRVDQKTHQVLFSPNVPWTQVDLYSELQRVLEAPVELENAVNACLVAERWFGNYGEASNIIVVGVSDGIGTGLMVDGRLARGKDDMAGEFGHMPIESSGPVCGCGNVGCWETFASNRAGLRYYHEFVPDSTVSTFKELLDLAMDGDIQALRSIDKMMMYLSRGLTIMVAGLSPEVVIIVGDCTVLVATDFADIGEPADCEVIPAAATENCARDGRRCSATARCGCAGTAQSIVQTRGVRRNGTRAKAGGRRCSRSQLMT